MGSAHDEGGVAARFARVAPVRFADCDSAGIAFYPRLLEMLNAAVEDWADERLGCPFTVMHGELRRGLPTAHLDIDFLAPLRLGERVEVSLEPTRVGETSITLTFAYAVAGEVRVEGRSVLVWMDLDRAPGGVAASHARAADGRRREDLRVSGHQTLLPPGWPRPKGYSAGIAAEGRMVFVAGLVGWDESGRFVSDQLAGQFRQVLVNTLSVLAEAGAGAADVARMTWYITDRDAYLAAAPELGAIWRELMGRTYPVMAVVIVAGLIERAALIEIETTAVVAPRGLA